MDATGAGRRLEDLRELRRGHKVLKASGLKAVSEAAAVGYWLRQGRLGSEAIQAVSRK